MSWDLPPSIMKGKTQGAPPIAYRIFYPSGPAAVAVLMTFGYFENMKRYREVIERWNARGILAAIYDVRGHGLSGGARGFISRFDEYVDDALGMLDVLEQDAVAKALAPPMLFGHSLGGLISIHTALRAPERIGGLALSSPYLSLAQKVPRIKRFAGEMLSRYAPSVSLAGNLKGSDCTHSADIAEAYDLDPLNFQKANVRWFTETVNAQERALEKAPELKLPVFCVQASDDRVTRPDATKAFMDRIGSVDRRFVIAQGAFHEVLNEPDRKEWIGQFADALLGWRPVIRDARTEA